MFFLFSNASVIRSLILNLSLSVRLFVCPRLIELSDLATLCRLRSSRGGKSSITTSRKSNLRLLWLSSRIALTPSSKAASMPSYWFLAIIGFVIQANLAYSSYDYGSQKRPVSKRQSSIIQTTGVKNNGVQSRQEIRQLEQNTMLWTLYILGLDMLQYTDQNDELSWYQIAGP
jgi:hypothetical protein